MEGERLRGVVAVGLVCAAIVAAFFLIDSGDGPPPGASTNIGSSTTTTRKPTTTLPRSADDQLCDLAADYQETTSGLYTGNTTPPGTDTTDDEDDDTTDDEDDDTTTPVDGIVIDALESFYTAAAALNIGEVTPEFDAAARHYALYNQIGAAFAFDTEEILRDGTENDRWIRLVTLPALGVDESRTYVLAVCQVSLPEAPSEDLEEIEDLLDEILDDEEDDE